MIGSASLIAGAMLLLLLLAVVTKGWLAARQLQDVARASREEDAMEPCAQEVVSRIFSRADWEFVRGLKAGRIERLFVRERKRIALVWVRQTSAIIRRVMREHAEAARQSANLKFSTEINIQAQFLTLMAVCGTLAVAIQIAGPLWLGGLAQYAQRLSRQVIELQESFQAGSLAKAEGAGRV